MLTGVLQPSGDAVDAQRDQLAERLVCLIGVGYALFELVGHADSMLARRNSIPAAGQSISTILRRPRVPCLILKCEEGSLNH